MSVSIKLNIRDSLTALRLLKVRGPVAVARALNRAKLAVRTFMAKNIAADTKLKSSDVKAALVMSDATRTKLNISISASMKRISLIKFQAKGPTPSRGRGKGVRAKTPAGKYPHAFIAQMGSGHLGVFQRIGHARLKIYELKGPSLGHVFDKFSEQGMAVGREALSTNLRSELKYALSKT